MRPIVQHALSFQQVAAVAVVCFGLVTAAEAAEGEIKKIDAAQGKITLKHGEIKSLDMPAMTMAYRARPVTLLNGLQVGDTIDFSAEKVDGQYVVTAVRKLR